MASLVAPLVSGIPGASSGSVVFYQAGTATEATVYSDSEGVGPVSGPHTLDANGGIVLYVKERVDVVVMDIDEATVREFTWGTDAREARLENLGFTGPDFSGMILPGGRTTVDAALTSLSESLGTTDGLVMVNGEAVPISTAFNQAAGLVYNVKSGYGALGDGLTNDSPSVQAAINAADAAGGGIIFFPQGTYLLNSAITVATSTGRFTYLGASATSTFLKQGTSGITMLSLGASNANLLLGLTFTATAANTGTLVSVGNSGRATFLGCSFEPVNGAHVACADAAEASATFVNCAISQAGALSRIGTGISAAMRFVACDISTAGAELVSFDSGTAVVSFSACTLRLGITGGSGAAVQFIDGSMTGTFAGCRFVCEYASGTAAIVGSVSGCFSGCVFEVTSTGLLTMGNATSVVIESASRVLTTGITVGGSTSASFRSQYRDHRMTQISGGSETSYTPSSEYAIHEVSSSGASMLFNTPDPMVPSGQPLIILYENISGGSVTPTFSTAYSFVVAPAVVTTGNSALYYFLARFDAITSDLVCISPQPANGVPL